MDKLAVKVSLTKGKYALVDKQDLSLVSQYNWQARFSRGNWYAVHSTSGNDVFMHNLVFGKHETKEVDHINRDGLDNRKSNLRYASASENRANVAIRRDNTSGYKGVSLCKKSKKWRAYIQKNNAWKQIGKFQTKEEAAQAYNKVAYELFGEFAWQNPIH